MKLLQVLSLTIVWLSYALAQKEEDGRHGTDRLKIEGFIERPFGIMASDSSWFSRTRVYTEAGQTAFIRSVFFQAMKKIIRFAFYVLM